MNKYMSIWSYGGGRGQEGSEKIRINVKLQDKFVLETVLQKNLKKVIE